MSTDNIIPFRFHAREVRVFPSDDGLSFWAVAKDITDILNIRSAHDALRYVPDHHKGTFKVRTPGGEQDMLCVDEAGMYRLVLRSNKPEAEPFMEWVTAEVLPSIRRHGFYSGEPQYDETGLPLSLGEERKAQRRQMSHLKALLFQADPRLKQIVRYKIAGLNHKEIGKLLDMHRSTVTRLVKEMAAAGLFRFGGQIVPGQSQGKTYPKVGVAPQVVNLPIKPRKPSPQRDARKSAPDDEHGPSGDLFA